MLSTYGLELSINDFVSREGLRTLLRILYVLKYLQRKVNRIGLKISILGLIRIMWMTPTVACKIFLVLTSFWLSLKKYPCILYTNTNNNFLLFIFSLHDNIIKVHKCSVFCTINIKITYHLNLVKLNLRPSFIVYWWFRYPKMHQFTGSLFYLLNKKQSIDV